MYRYTPYSEDKEDARNPKPSQPKSSSKPKPPQDKPYFKEPYFHWYRKNEDSDADSDDEENDIILRNLKLVDKHPILTPKDILTDKPAIVHLRDGSFQGFYCTPNADEFTEPKEYKKDNVLKAAAILNHLRKMPDAVDSVEEHIQQNLMKNTTIPVIGSIRLIKEFPVVSEEETREDRKLKKDNRYILVKDSSSGKYTLEGFGANIRDEVREIKHHVAELERAERVVAIMNHLHTLIHKPVRFW